MDDSHALSFACPLEIGLDNFEGVAIFLENTAQKPFTLYAYVTIYIRAKHKPLTWNTTKQTQKK